MHWIYSTFSTFYLYVGKLTILNAFQNTVHQYDIPKELIDAFMKSMKLDLSKTEYKTISEYNEYIQNSSNLNKRMMNLLVERLKSQVQII